MRGKALYVLVFIMLLAGVSHAEDISGRKVDSIVGKITFIDNKEGVITIDSSKITVGKNRKLWSEDFWQTFAQFKTGDFLAIDYVQVDGSKVAVYVRKGLSKHFARQVGRR